MHAPYLTADSKIAWLTPYSLVCTDYARGLILYLHQLKPTLWQGWCLCVHVPLTASSVSGGFHTHTTSGLAWGLSNSECHGGIYCVCDCSDLYGRLILALC